MSRAASKMMSSVMGKSKKAKKGKKRKSISGQLSSTMNSMSRSASSMMDSLMGKSKKRGKKKGGTRRRSRQLNKELRQLRF
jgi:hypothetical protein